MARATPTVLYRPERDYRRSFLLLRWLVIILAAYLTVFTYIKSELFGIVAVFVLAFAMSNVVWTLLPAWFFHLRWVQVVLLVTDIVCVSATLFLLKTPESYLYVPFILIFAMTVVWRDLKVVAFSLISVSLLYGVFSAFRLIDVTVDDHIKEFLTLSLFFIVAIFYLFLSDRLRQDAQMSAVLLEEKRRAEVMGEIAGSISSSLYSQEILSLIAARLTELFDASECLIVRMDPGVTTATVLVQSGPAHGKNTTVELDDHPEFVQASDSKDILFLPEVLRDGVAQTVIAIPMLAQDAKVGVISLRLNERRSGLSDSDERFFKVMSLTAANALRNAQLFEEMEHRARTDFLTGLPNHRFFQSTLSTELGRAHRHNHPLSLLIVDLDYLKEVNDRFGHPAGDMVIRGVAETIRSTCRQFDFAARYGGEEFTIILPETPLPGAIQVAERFRERIAALEFPGLGSVTASVGVSNYPVNALGKEDLIRVADQALYVAKNNGRDRIAHFNYQLITR